MTPESVDCAMKGWRAPEGSRWVRLHWPLLAARRFRQAPFRRCRLFPWHGAVVTGAAAIGAAVTGKVTQLHLVALNALAERAQLVLVILFTAMVLSLPDGRSLAAEPVTVAVADFDYSDTSGEIEDQVEAHRARVVAFGQLLRDSLQSEGKYSVVRLDCQALALWSMAAFAR
jgi:hypothetical protein